MSCDGQKPQNRLGRPSLKVAKVAERTKRNKMSSSGTRCGLHQSEKQNVFVAPTSVGSGRVSFFGLAGLARTGGLDLIVSVTTSS